MPPTPTVLQTYQRHATTWATLRGTHLYETPWLDRFCALLPPAAHILDIGCGAGQPLAAELIRRGHPLTGIDGSPAMLALFRRNLPDTPAHLMDMRHLALTVPLETRPGEPTGDHVRASQRSGLVAESAAGNARTQPQDAGNGRPPAQAPNGPLARRFAGLLAWDSFFHLSPDDQRATIPRFAAHAAPGAPLMFTSGDAEGVAIGDLDGTPLYHASLDPAEYRTRLAAAGFTILAHVTKDPTCGHRTIWLAQRTRTPADARAA